MRIIIVVDANIILSALLGGKPSIILFDTKFQFITTQFTLDEVKKYLPRLVMKLNVSRQELSSLLNQLPLKVYKRSFYKDNLERARKFIGYVDKKDVDILALALEFEAYLWSQDKHFEKAGYRKLLKTYNFIS